MRWKERSALGPHILQMKGACKQQREKQTLANECTGVIENLDCWKMVVMDREGR